jgi:hypothetical protein
LRHQRLHGPRRLGPATTSRVCARLRLCLCDTWTALVQLRLHFCDYASATALHFCDCASATALLSRMQLLCPECSYCATANSDCWACDCWAATTALLRLRLLRLRDNYCCAVATGLRATTTAPLRLHRSNYTAPLAHFGPAGPPAPSASSTLSPGACAVKVCSSGKVRCVKLTD